MWADIENGILEMVLLLLNLAGVACVASVCTRWRRIVKSFATDRRLTLRHCSWLVISDRPYEQATALMNPLRRPTSPLTRRFCGAFDDWLVINDMIDGVYLYHPLLHRVQLPPLTTPPLNIANNGFDHITYLNCKYVRKVILSSSPTSAECLVAIIFGNRELAFCGLGDSNWTKYESDDESEMWRFYEDAVFYNGHLVAVDNQEFIWSFRLKSGQVERQLLFQPTADWVVQLFSMCFLVVSMGQLLLVIQKRKTILVPYGRHGMRVHCGTYDFRIFQLDVNGRKRMPLETLGKRVMFLTETLSTVVASDEIEGFGSDCIYFTEFMVLDPMECVFFMSNKRMQFRPFDEVGPMWCWENVSPLFFSMFKNFLSG